MSEEMNVSVASSQKEQMIKQAKEDALSMVKIASFRGAAQDPYPSPFLNLSDTKIPETSQEIFRWCKYFYMFDPLIAGAVNALSAFPITEVYLEDIETKSSDDQDDSDILKTYDRVLHKNLNIHKLLIEIGIDYYLYGNCFVFGEMYENPMTGLKEWKTMVRLDPSKMVIDYNPTTQEKIYKWEVPASVARIVRNKKPKAEYNKIPDTIKKAVLENKMVVLSSKNVYHFARATDSLGDNNVWGTPVVANVLKLLMYRNILRQAQEAIAREHIVPLRVYYLQRTEDYNPEADWNAVAANFAQELMKSVKDPNHKVVSPVPVNLLNVGGQGKSLMLTAEIEQIQAEILAGMNVPREFIFGGVSYSSSSISLKILENQFITYRVLLKDFIQNFIIKGMAKARKEWVNEKDDEQLVSVKMTDLKMQDDVQQKTLIIQLNGAGKCSDEYMWKTLGIDPDKMREVLEREALAAVELESKIRLKQMEMQIKEMDTQYQLQQKQVQMNSQLQSQQMQNDQQIQTELMANQAVIPGTSPVPEGQMAPAGDVKQPTQPTEKTQEAPDPMAGMDPEIKNFATQVMKLPAAYRDTPISKFPANVQKQIKRAIQLMETSEDTKKQSQIDMRPMPEQLPPRRDSLK